MSKAPSMPMYWDAYLADTTHLTTEEHGAYLLLLAAMWRRDGSVPDDDKDNARIIGLSKTKWRKIKTRLSSFLIFENDTISQKNLQKIWKKTQEKIQKNIENGRKGGRPVSNENNGLAKANGSGSVNPNDNPNVTMPEPEPEPEPEEDKEDKSSSSPSNDDELSPQKVASLWNEICIKLRPVNGLSLDRENKIKNLIRTPLDNEKKWELFFNKISNSSFLRGEKESFQATFDWVINPRNAVKILDGNYDDRENQQFDPAEEMDRIIQERKKKEIAANAH